MGKVHLPTVRSNKDGLVSLLVMTEYRPANLEPKQSASLRMPERIAATLVSSMHSIFACV